MKKMTKINVRVFNGGNWRKIKVVVPHSFNFPSSRLNYMDALHEWVEQHFRDKMGTDFMSEKLRGKPPLLFYITHLDNKSIFNL